jgi:hypothetical protein
VLGSLDKGKREPCKFYLLSFGFFVLLDKDSIFSLGGRKRGKNFVLKRGAKDALFHISPFEKNEYVRWHGSQ